MLRIIGGLVVYGLAIYGLVELKNKVKKSETKEEVVKKAFEEN